MRSLRRFAPSFASGAVFHHRDRPEREGSVRSLWYGAAPYLLSTMAVALALAVRLLLLHLGARDMKVSLFLFAIAVSVWQLGPGPGIAAVVLSALAYAFYASEQHSLSISAAEAPSYLAFILFALMITGFTAVRRRVESELLHTRDRLQKEATERQLREEQDIGIHTPCALACPTRPVNQAACLRAFPLGAILSG